jgi:P-type Ca2+ transporter type 2C
MTVTSQPGSGVSTHLSDLMKVDNTAGLSEAEAAERLRIEGPNELPSSKPRTIWEIAWGVVREPMFLLLLGFVFVVMGITLYQERKTERALVALRDLSSPRALVIRDTQRRRIAGRDVVPDDILVISEGDRVPADGVLLSAVNISVDESLLTGESVPVRKRAADVGTPIGSPGGDDLPFVYSGTLVVQGRESRECRPPALRRNSARSEGPCGRSKWRTPRFRRKPPGWSRS